MFSDQTSDSWGTSQINYKLKKSVDGVLGIQTQGRRMVGGDKTTELWRPPTKSVLQCSFD